MRAHGLRGEVVVDLWSGRPERLAPGAVFSTDGGDLVVRSSRPHGGRYLVALVGIVDRTGAERLRGAVLRAPPLQVAGVLWVHELVGAEVVTPDGRAWGRVQAVEPNPASDLLALEGGRLVPLRFVVDHRPGERVVVDVPDGLLDDPEHEPPGGE